MAERKSLAAEIAAMREGAYVPHPWWVRLDPPVSGMWARGLDQCGLMATLIANGMRGTISATNDPDVAYVAFPRPVELLAVDEPFMRQVMACARLSAAHGTYRECGQTEKGYKF